MRAKFFQIHQRRLARELRIHQVAADALQYPLRIEHFDDAALAKAICSFGRIHGAHRCAQRTGLQRSDLLIGQLILLVGAFQRRISSSVLW